MAWLPLMPGVSILILLKQVMLLAKVFVAIVFLIEANNEGNYSK